MPDEASLHVFLTAESRTRHDGELWDLDGTEYIVPESVVESAKKIEEDVEDGIDDHVDLLFDRDFSRGRSAKELLEDNPESFYTDRPGTSLQGPATVRYGPDNARYKFGAGAAWSRRDAVKQAYETAVEQYPNLVSLYFPEDYSPEVIGPAKHINSRGWGVTDRALWDAFIGELEAMSEDYRTNMFHSRLRTITDRPAGIRAINEGFGDDETVFVNGPRASTSTAHTQHVTIWAPSDQPVLDAAEALKAYIDDALQSLEAKYPENWERWYGRTEIDIVEGYPP